MIRALKDFLGHVSDSGEGRWIIVAASMKPYLCLSRAQLCINDAALAAMLTLPIEFSLACVTSSAVTRTRGRLALHRSWAKEQWLPDERNLMILLMARYRNFVGPTVVEPTKFHWFGNSSASKPLTTLSATSS